MKKTIGRFTRKLLPAVLIAALLLSISLFSGCSAQGYQKNTKLDTSEKVSLIVAGSTSDFKAMEIATNKFTELYPNCTVRYEYIQDFDKNLPVRLTAEDEQVDLFISSNIQADSPYLESALDLLSYPEQLDLSGVFPGMINNYKFYKENESDPDKLYALPMGGELRGLFVNKTLLASLDLSVPTNQKEFLAACEKLSAAGYIPCQGNPGIFGQRLLFPWIAHLISAAEDHDAVYNMVNTADEKTAELFRAPMEFMYTLVEKNYYNYKYVENTYNTQKDLSSEGSARDFLNIVADGDSFKKKDDLGQVAFMPASNALETSMDKIKEDYHSAIEYEFILAPVTENGGFAYMSPTNGLAINKNTKHLDWALEFMNFFFTPENNKEFAENNNVIPNTKDALEVIGKKYNISSDMIGQPEDVTFRYAFYNTIVDPLMSVSKANNPKYMDKKEDGSAVMYSFDHYMALLKDSFAAQREAMSASKS